MDWKGILDKALDIGGPVLGAVADVEAPGTGRLVVAGTGMLKEQVVDRYVPGEAPPIAPASTPPPKAAAPPPALSSDAQAAANFLLKKGYTPAEVEQHLQGPAAPPARPRSPLETVAEKGVTHEEAAHVVHRTLQTAKWSPEQITAILAGPEATHIEPRKGVADPMLQKLASGEVRRLQELKGQWRKELQRPDLDPLIREHYERLLREAETTV